MTRPCFDNSRKPTFSATLRGVNTRLRESGIAVALKESGDMLVLEYIAAGVQWFMGKKMDEQTA
jgi:hypothetical protein